ncbi:DUF4157 domain-containing protein [Streptomyces ossamyceticus]
MSIHRSQALQLVPKSTSVPNRPEESRAPGPPPAASGLRHSFADTEVAPSTQVQRVLSAPGRPLDEPLRQEMEARLGADLSTVRIHSDAAAERSATAVDSRAYTSGEHIVGGPGALDRRTIAHELIHVLQQRSGPVAGNDHGDGLRVSDPSDRFEREADANAQRVMAGPAATDPQSRPSAEGGRAPMVSSAGEHIVQRARKSRPERAPALIIQRSATEDVEAGNIEINTASDYAGDVLGRFGSYGEFIKELDDPEGGKQEMAVVMGRGYKAWSKNFYNKTQAYLFEADLVSSNATMRPRQLGGGRATVSLPYLGVNTDTDADMAIRTEYIENDRISKSTHTALEVKASTADAYASIDGLVAGGIKQLRKRELTGQFQNLMLELHSDGSSAHWPITEFELASGYGNDRNMVPDAKWKDRLEERITAMKNTNSITSPLTVKVTYNGRHSYTVQV